MGFTETEFTVGESDGSFLVTVAVLDPDPSFIEPSVMGVLLVVQIQTINNTASGKVLLYFFIPTLQPAHLNSKFCPALYIYIISA